MRAIWKGAVSFGLVTVPVRLYTATENHDLKFHQVRRPDGSRVRYKKVAEADGEEVPSCEIVKGYDTADGRTVIITDEELAALDSRSAKEISVEKFVPADQIDPLLLDRSYYLEPDKTAVKPYTLLREALATTDRMAVVTVSVRARLSMAVLRVREDVIVMQTMLWPDEVREPAFDEIPEPTQREVAMTDLLIESMVDDFEPNGYEDDYHAAVQALVERKLAGGEVQAAPAAKDGNDGEVVDLLAALQRSVDRAKAARGEQPDAQDAGAQGSGSDSESGSGDDAASARTSTRKSAKAATAKKAQAAKTPAKKAAAKRAPRKAG
ncbi:Ku protein [Arsenicicoccus dermatophilus]|uniref:non-homologous end joining protein Ku n=1 Tax=Arsenicicoccus dermatophilus TaxID=1076331 RepID=UPI001F4C622C|nr:Ku protein [Arsenicicoccus dermatophilus]MCH8611657.1 Ku protein [Arsenicicoccus dermatophilus]